MDTRLPWIQGSHGTNDTMSVPSLRIFDSLVKVFALSCQAKIGAPPRNAQRAPPRNATHSATPPRRDTLKS